MACMVQATTTKTNGTNEKLLPNLEMISTTKRFRFMKQQTITTIPITHCRISCNPKSRTYKPRIPGKEQCLSHELPLLKSNWLSWVNYTAFRRRSECSKICCTSTSALSFFELCFPAIPLLMFFTYSLIYPCRRLL